MGCEIKIRTWSFVLKQRGLGHEGRWKVRSSERGNNNYSVALVLNIPSGPLERPTISLPFPSSSQSYSCSPSHDLALQAVIATSPWWGTAFLVLKTRYRSAGHLHTRSASGTQYSALRQGLWEQFNNGCLPSTAYSPQVRFGVVRWSWSTDPSQASIGVPSKSHGFVEHEVINDFYQEIRLG